MERPEFRRGGGRRHRRPAGALPRASRRLSRACSWAWPRCSGCSTATGWWPRSTPGCARWPRIAIIRCARRAPRCSPISSGGWSSDAAAGRARGGGQGRAAGGAGGGRAAGRGGGGAHPRAAGRPGRRAVGAGWPGWPIAWSGPGSRWSPTGRCGPSSTPGSKARLTELIERHHGRIAEFIENGVRALGPEGAVRLIEEHAGDDLQFIRVNGTVVGGLAGGAIYAIHLMLRAFGP